MWAEEEFWNAIAGSGARAVSPRYRAYRLVVRVISSRNSNDGSTPVDDQSVFYARARHVEELWFRGIDLLEISFIFDMLDPLLGWNDVVVPRDNGHG